MSNSIKNIALVALLCALAACGGGVRDAMGLKGRAPDEFRVVSNAPLVVPPEFTLRPPMPGAKRPQELDLQRQAKDILFEARPQRAAVAESKSESLFLRKADAGDADPEIKNILVKEEQDDTASKQKKGFFEKIVSYASNDKSKEPLVDPGKEKKRLEENKKEGKPASEGVVAETKEKKSGLLNRIFGF